MSGGRRYPEAGWLWSGRAERWRTPAVVAVSVLGHIAVFAWFGARSMDLPAAALMQPRRGPVVYLDIEPRLTFAGERTGVRPPSAPPQAAAAARGSPAADRSEPRFSAPGSPAPPADAGMAPWRVRPRAPGDRVGQALRTRGPGCASPELLSAAERAVCADRFGERAGVAPPVAGTGNPERDARFAREGDRRLADYERRRRPLSGRPGVSLPDDCGGSNLGFGCAGSHLAPEFRQDRESTLNQVLGADRGDPTSPRLPRARQPED